MWFNMFFFILFEFKDHGSNKRIYLIPKLILLIGKITYTLGMSQFAFNIRSDLQILRFRIIVLLK